MIGAGESETVEFKARPPHPDIVAKVFAAFANTSGGVLLIGVQEDGQITGLSHEAANAALDTITAVASSLLPWPLEYGRPTVDGKLIVYARVPKAPGYLAPITTAWGEIPKRRGVQILEQSPADAAPTSIAAGSSPPLTLFVAMSFREEVEPALVDYFHAIERAAEQSALPVVVTRIDLEEGDFEISQKIMDKIVSADIVLADFTLTPANVYFEIGYARGRQKRVIQTARKGTALEFDVRNWRTLFYRNATELEHKLVPEIKSAYRDCVRPVQQQ